MFSNFVNSKKNFNQKRSMQKKKSALQTIDEEGQDSVELKPSDNGELNQGQQGFLPQPFLRDLTPEQRNLLINQTSRQANIGVGKDFKLKLKPVSEELYWESEPEPLNPNPNYPNKQQFPSGGFKSSPLRSSFLSKNRIYINKQQFPSGGAKDDYTSTPATLPTLSAEFVNADKDFFEVKSGHCQTHYRGFSSGDFWRDMSFATEETLSKLVLTPEVSEELGVEELTRDVVLGLEKKYINFNENEPPIILPEDEESIQPIYFSNSTQNQDSFNALKDFYSKDFAPKTDENHLSTSTPSLDDMLRDYRENKKAKEREVLEKKREALVLSSKEEIEPETIEINLEQEYAQETDENDRSITDNSDVHLDPSLNEMLQDDIENNKAKEIEVLVLSSKEEIEPEVIETNPKEEHADGILQTLDPEAEIQKSPRAKEEEIKSSCVPNFCLSFSLFAKLKRSQSRKILPLNQNSPEKSNGNFANQSR